MDAGTRPAGKRGSGAWSPDALAAEVGVSRRTIENYRNGSTQPPDATPIADAFFGSDPRHAVTRNAFLISFAEATGTEPPPWAFAVSNVPVSVPTHFMGREEALATIRAALGRYEGRVAITALHGLRGVGKTTLAAAYAERQRADYRATWWIRAQTEATMRSDLVALGVRLGWVDAKEKDDPAFAKVAERLQHEGEGVLLVYDNAIDARRLTPYLPRGGAARILITSNAHDWRSVAEPVEIRLWPKAVGADYLIARTGRVAERDAGEALSETLGGLPLAHEQAAAYCERLGIAFAEYGRRFAANPAKMLDDQRHAPTGYRDGLTVAKTFGLAIEAAAAEHPAAELLVMYLALLPPEAIPLFVLEEGRSALGEPLAELLADDGLDEAVAALRAFALVDKETITDGRLDAPTDVLRLHRLVREVAAARLTVEGRERAQRALIEALELVRRFLDETLAHRELIETRLFVALIRSDFSVPEGAEEQAATLLTHVGLNWKYALENHLRALPFLERALAIREKALGPEHLDTSASLFYLALSLLENKGDEARARPLLERALAIFEKVLGPNAAAVILRFVARRLEEQGDLEGARSYLERALANYERVPGSEQFETATILKSLASLLRKQGDLEGARPLFERALSIYTRVFGPEHPSTRATFSSFVRLWRDQRKLADGADTR